VLGRAVLGGVLGGAVDEVGGGKGEAGGEDLFSDFWGAW